MSNDWLPATLSDIVSDAYALLLPGVPGSVVAGGIVRETVLRLQRERAERAFKLLVDEVGRGKRLHTHDQDLDETVAKMIRYQRAAAEGTARINLRLMARIFAGASESRPVVADEFQSWADVLQGLRRLEIIAIAKVHEYTVGLQNGPEHESPAQHSDAYEEGLVPHLFRSKDEFRAVCRAASRSGLIADTNDYNLLPYLSTPLMDQLASLTDFQDAIRKEGVL